MSQSYTQAEVDALVAAAAAAARTESSDYKATLRQTPAVNKATGKPNKTAGQWNLNIGSYRFKVGIGFESLTPTVANVDERLDILRANVARIVAVLDTSTAEGILTDAGFTVEPAPKLAPFAAQPPETQAMLTAAQAAPNGSGLASRIARRS